MSQTTGYGYNLDVAQAGQKYDLMFDQVDSYAAEGAVQFGAGVEQGTADDQAATFAGGTFVGIALFQHTVENRRTTGTASYVDTATMSVLRHGRAWVEVTGAFTKEAPAYITDAGAFTATEGTNTLVGKFITSGQDELGVVEVNAGA